MYLTHMHALSQARSTTHLSRSLPVLADKATLFKFPPASFAAPSFAQAPTNHYSQAASEEAER